MCVCVVGGMGRFVLQQSYGWLFSSLSDVVKVIHHHVQNIHGVHVDSRLCAIFRLWNEIFTFIIKKVLFYCVDIEKESLSGMPHMIFEAIKGLSDAKGDTKMMELHYGIVGICLELKVPHSPKICWGYRLQPLCRISSGI